MSAGLPYAALMLGCRMLNHGPHNDPDTVLEMCVDWGATWSAAVPTVWQNIRSRLEADPARYAGKLKIGTVVCGGSAPPNEMMRWCVWRGQPSSTAPRLPHVPRPAPRKRGRSGRAVERSSALHTPPRSVTPPWRRRASNPFLSLSLSLLPESSSHGATVGPSLSPPEALIARHSLPPPLARLPRCPARRASRCLAQGTSTTTASSSPRAGA